jgi:hypothetical protein
MSCNVQPLTLVSYYRHGLWFWFSQTLMYMLGPLIVSLVMESCQTKCRSILDHIPIVSVFLRLRLLKRLRPLWTDLFQLQEETEKLNIQKIENDEEKKDATKKIQRYNQVLSEVTRLNIKLLESYRFEVLCESAPQAILQISIFFQTGNWTKTMAFGAFTSTLSLAIGFITFNSYLPTENTTVSIHSKNSLCSTLKQYFTAFIILLCTPCCVLMMAMLVSYMNLYVLPLFICVSFLSVHINQTNNFTFSSGLAGLKGKLMKGMTNTFVPCAQRKVKVNLLKGWRCFLTTTLAVICQFFYITTYFILSILFLVELIPPFGYQIDLMGTHKITNKPILYCANYDVKICCKNSLTERTNNSTCNKMFRASEDLKENQKCFLGIVEEHDDFLKTLEEFAKTSFRNFDLSTSESVPPELEFVTYCPKGQFKLTNLTKCLYYTGFSLELRDCFIQNPIMTCVLGICALATFLMFLLTLLTKQKPLISKKKMKSLVDGTRFKDLPETLQLKFKSAMSCVHFGRSNRNKLSDFTAMNKIFNDEINQEVLELAITHSNLNLLKYASDLGLVKTNITDNCFKKACEKGDLKVIKHLVSVFLTIDFAGNT